MENYEYELPSDFEDEEIDEDMAFTAEDKKLYAGWFGEEEEEQQAEEARSDGQQRRSKRSKLGDFADLESSSDEESDGDEVGGCVLERKALPLGSCAAPVAESCCPGRPWKEFNPSTATHCDRTHTCHAVLRAMPCWWCTSG